MMFAYPSAHGRKSAGLDGAALVAPPHAALQCQMLLNEHGAHCDRGEGRHNAGVIARKSYRDVREFSLQSAERAQIYHRQNTAGFFFGVNTSTLKHDKAVGSERPH